MGGITNPENTDNRAPGVWKSNYEPEAMSKIKFEAWFLILTYTIAPIFSFLIWTNWPSKWFSWDINQYLVFKKYALIFLGGLFGGTIFDIKWLIHAVATQKWNIDRRLWRLLVPLISGAFSLAFGTIVASGFVKIFDPKSLESPVTAFGFGFLVGYFSDNAIAKLSEVAQTLFGTLEGKTKDKSRQEISPQESPPQSSAEK